MSRAAAATSRRARRCTTPWQPSSSSCSSSGSSRSPAMLALLLLMRPALAAHTMSLYPPYPLFSSGAALPFVPPLLICFLRQPMPPAARAAIGLPSAHPVPTPPKAAPLCCLYACTVARPLTPPGHAPVCAISPPTCPPASALCHRGKRAHAPTHHCISLPGTAPTCAPCPPQHPAALA